MSNLSSDLWRLCLKRANRGEGVKAGGVATRRRFQFELTGGRLCLDFANTVDERRSARPKELLGDYDRLVSWGAQAGAITAHERRRLLSGAARRPADALKTLVRARALREALFAIFSDFAAGREPGTRTLQPLQDALPGALARLRLGPAREAFAWVWADDDGSLDRVLWPVVRSAAELLTSGERDRLRQCAGDRCAWLFMDRSRNGTRRWCDMGVCGNRSKARRHYRRIRAAG